MANGNRLVYCTNSASPISSPILAHISKARRILSFPLAQASGLIGVEKRDPIQYKRRFAVNLAKACDPAENRRNG